MPEDIGTYLETLLVIVAVCGFFWALKSSVDRNTSAVQSLQSSLERTAQRQITADEASAHRQAALHAELVGLIREIAQTQSNEHKDLLKSTVQDHKDMSHIVGDTARVLAKIDARLESHMQEERAK